MPVEGLQAREKYSGKRRKQGDSISKVAAALIDNPSVTTRELSAILDVSVQTARAALKKVFADPDVCSARCGIDDHELIIAIIIRGGAHEARKKCKSSKTKVIKCKGNFKKSRKTKIKWRGKGNWPAAEAAKTRISAAGAAKWCRNEYTRIKNDVFKFDESRAGRRPDGLPHYYPKF